VIENLEDTTQRLPIRVHTDGTASVQVRGSKGDTYTLKFGQNDFDSCTCTCKGYTYSKRASAPAWPAGHPAQHPR